MKRSRIESLQIPRGEMMDNVGMFIGLDGLFMNAWKVAHHSLGGFVSKLINCKQPFCPLSALKLLKIPVQKSHIEKNEIVDVKVRGGTGKQSVSKWF